MAETEGTTRGDQGPISDKEVHAGYTAQTAFLTDSSCSENFGGAGGNGTKLLILRPAHVAGIALKKQYEGYSFPFMERHQSGKSARSQPSPLL